MVVQRTLVGGVMSEGIFCDSKMLGWTTSGGGGGGAEGIAQQIPDDIDVGAAPPLSKRRGKTDSLQTNSTSPDVPAVEVKPLFEKKLTKEEKKKIAEEKRLAKKAAKATAATTTTTTNDEENTPDE